MGLLSGRHDPIGTAYHLLLKRSLRERTAVEAGRGGGNGRRRGANQHNNDDTTGQAVVAQTPSTERGVDHRVNGNSEDRRGGGREGASRSGNGFTQREGAGHVGQAGQRSSPAPTIGQKQHQQQQPATGPKVEETTPRVIHGNASYASSTSSSRSGRPPFSTARRRDSTGGSTATAVVAGGRAESSPNSKVFRARQPQQTPPQSSATASRSTRPSGPAAAVMATVQKRQQAGTAAGDGQAETRKCGSGETRIAAPVETHGRNSGRGGDGGSEEHRGGQEAAQVMAPRRPVPKLSFRGISRTGGAGSIPGGREEIGKRPSSSGAVFASQTARARSNAVGADRGGAPTDYSTRQSRATAAAGHSRAAHRERAGSGSSNGSTIGSSGGSAGGFSAIKGGSALPRRPLTARAPLRSSAPTPRLSGDFSLARPQGSPLTSSNFSAAPSPRTAARPTSGREQGGVSLGAPLAAEPVATGAGAASPVLSVSTKRSTARQQPSLRVRLSNLSSKPGVSQHQQRRLEPSVPEVGAAEAGAARATATTLVTRKNDTNSSPAPKPRRPSFSSTSPASGNFAPAPTGGSSAAARVFWGKGACSAPPGGSSSDRDGRTASSSSPGVVAIRAPPHASTPATKSWARGGGVGGYPEALHNSGNRGGAAHSSAERAQCGG